MQSIKDPASREKMWSLTTLFITPEMVENDPEIFALDEKLRSFFPATLTRADLCGDLELRQLNEKLVELETEKMDREQIFFDLIQSIGDESLRTKLCEEHRLFFNRLEEKRKKIEIQIEFCKAKYRKESSSQNEGKEALIEILKSVKNNREEAKLDLLTEKTKQLFQAELDYTDVNLICVLIENLMLVDITSKEGWEKKEELILQLAHASWVDGYFPQECFQLFLICISELENRSFVKEIYQLIAKKTPPFDFMINEFLSYLSFEDPDLFFNQCLLDFTPTYIRWERTTTTDPTVLRDKFFGLVSLIQEEEIREKIFGLLDEEEEIVQPLRVSIRPISVEPNREPEGAGVPKEETLPYLDSFDISEEEQIAWAIQQSLEDFKNRENQDHDRSDDDSLERLGKSERRLRRKPPRGSYNDDEA